VRSPVAVVIVNFHVYPELDRVLASVRALTRPDDEVVVFDQESDASAARRIQAAHPEVRWIASDRNLGFAAAVNRSARETTAPFLLLLNPDAVAGEGLLDALASWLETHPETGLAGPRVFDDDGTVQASARRFPTVFSAIAGRSTWLSLNFPDNWLTRRHLLARDADRPVTVDWLAGSCLMVRRDLFERLGGFDEGYFLYWEDADLAWRARQLGYRATYLPLVAVTHTGGRSAAHNPGLAIREFHRSALRYFVRTTGPRGRWLAPLVSAALWMRAEWRVWWFVTRLGRSAVVPGRRVSQTGDAR
jgi:GT2 family glycosyltransferase